MVETESERLTWLGESVKDSVNFGARTTEDFGSDAEAFVQAAARFISGIVPETFASELADAEQRIRADYAAMLAAVEQRMAAERAAMKLEMERRLAEQNNQFNLWLLESESRPRPQRRHPWALALGVIGAVVGFIAAWFFASYYRQSAVTDGSTFGFVVTSIAASPLYMAVFIAAGTLVVSVVGGFLGYLIDIVRNKVDAPSAHVSQGAGD